MRNLTQLLQQDLNPLPLLGSGDWGQPYIFDLSSQNELVGRFDTTNFEAFQKEVFEELHASGHSWGLAMYLEERRELLRNYPQMIKEGRYYHLGLDVIVEGGTPLFAPLDGTIYQIGVEKGLGNYGGYIIMEHRVGDAHFYVFYGHLHDNHIVNEGDQIFAGTKFATVGDRAEHSGGWFTHTHMQILTERAIQEGHILKGYASAEDILQKEELFPSPYLIFRY